MTLTKSRGAVCIGILGKIQRKIQRANMKNIDFLWFFKEIRAKNFGKTFPRPRATFWQILSPVKLNIGHLVINFHFRKMPKKIKKSKTKSKQRTKTIKKFNFLAYLTPWDHSKLVDLFFAVRMVPVWPPETWMAPHWWQNKVPNPPTFYKNVSKM